MVEIPLNSLRNFLGIMWVGAMLCRFLGLVCWLWMFKKTPCICRDSSFKLIETSYYLDRWISSVIPLNLVGI